MSSTESTVIAAIAGLLATRDAGDTPVRLDSNLAFDLELDSLELAELSATLEDELGSDPFADGEVQDTVAELIAFYGQ